VLLVLVFGVILSGRQVTAQSPVLENVGEVSSVPDQYAFDPRSGVYYSWGTGTISNDAIELRDAVTFAVVDSFPIPQIEWYRTDLFFDPGIERLYVIGEYYNIPDTMGILVIDTVSKSVIREVRFAEVDGGDGLGISIDIDYVSHEVYIVGNRGGETVTLYSDGRVKEGSLNGSYGPFQFYFDSNIERGVVGVRDGTLRDNVFLCPKEFIGDDSFYMDCEGLWDTTGVLYSFNHRQSLLYFESTAYGCGRSCVGISQLNGDFRADITTDFVPIGVDEVSGRVFAYRQNPQDRRDWGKTLYVLDPFTLEERGSITFESEVSGVVVDSIRHFVYVGVCAPIPGGATCKTYRVRDNGGGEVVQIPTATPTMVVPTNTPFVPPIPTPTVTPTPREVFCLVGVELEELHNLIPQLRD
jgi:hypothetical protein